MDEQNIEHVCLSSIVGKLEKRRKGLTCQNDDINNNNHDDDGKYEKSDRSEKKLHFEFSSVEGPTGQAAGNCIAPPCLLSSITKSVLVLWTSWSELEKILYVNIFKKVQAKKTREIK